MHLPTSQQLLASGLALTNVLTGDSISKGSVLDYAVEKCIDGDGNVRCSKPFPVKADGCYKLSWTTDGTLSHTTVEVRDAGSGEMVYYRDTNGEWKPEKNELVYLDFKPKVWKTGNDTVDYEVTSCEKSNEL
ncbi:hypothetical protein LEL_06510 [Akanthomyces lecanii RCEF 1005]|uniref:CND01770-like protein n=1 Tax=Akanthomyces lecanii RCEF 1005 TaxID=1081108 RepID=A0A168GRJ1_CORDF|nr:hypothetical protein LEL_06510 [Akanthomyces lecanii RCEF 1005]